MDAPSVDHVENPVDPVRSLLLSYGHLLVADLIKSGAAPRAEGTLVLGESWGVRITTFRRAAGSLVADLSFCERQILALLEEAGDPLPAKEIRRQLQARNMGKFSIATVKRALHRLRKPLGKDRTRLLGNRRKRPQGYFLLDRQPLFEQPQHD